MKAIPMTLAALAAYMIAYAQQEMQSAFDEAILRIAFKESGNKNIGVHEIDGVSHGKHGVTIHPACDQLVQMKWITRLPTQEEICDPEINEKLARLYLLAMCKMYATKEDGTYDIKKAVGCYHGGTKAQRDQYSKEAYETTLP